LPSCAFPIYENSEIEIQQSNAKEAKMRQSKPVILLALIAGTTAWHQTIGQIQTQSPPPSIRGRTSKDASWTAYSSGGERGSLVHVISDPDAQAELKLDNEQQQRVGEILHRVKATEAELFEDLRRSQQEQSDGRRAQWAKGAKRYQDANQQLAVAVEKILALLTSAQKTRLQALCRQAKADEAGFLARFHKGPGSVGSGSGFGGGGFGGGGGGFRSGGSGGSTAGGSGGGNTGGAAGGGGGIGSTVNPAGAEQVWKTRNRYDSGGGPGGVVRVISIEGVQEQLGLSDEQRRQISAVTSQVSRFEKTFFSESSSRSDSSANEALELWKQKQDSTRQAVTAAGEEILRELEPAQQQRLKEICLQVEGEKALFKPLIIQALGLTAAQQIKLATIRQEAERQTSALYAPKGQPGQMPPPIDFKSARERAGAIERDTENRMLNSVLTPTQRSKFKEMQGQEFAGAARLKSIRVAGGAVAEATTASTDPGQ
jgi:hypothetical protein